MKKGLVDLSKMKGCNEFNKDNIKLSTTSNTVAKLYDALLYQNCGYFDAEEVGGIIGTIKAILENDPNFPLVKLFQYEAEGDETLLDELRHQLRSQYEHKGSTQLWSEQERLHCKAYLLEKEGYSELAREIWWHLLTCSPRDFLALRSLHQQAIMTGRTGDIAAPAALVKRSLAKEDKFQSHVLGYEAFGLTELGRLREGQKIAEQSLELCWWNTWSWHTLAHVYDSGRNPSGGLAAMKAGRDGWCWSGLGGGLQGHNLWHTGLMQLELGNVDEAVDIYDEEVWSRMRNQPSYFGMSDCVGLLGRLEMQRRSGLWPDLHLRERWQNLTSAITSQWQQGSSGGCFYDSLLLLASGLGFFGDKDDARVEAVDKFRQSLLDTVSKNQRQRNFDPWETEDIAELCRFFPENSLHVTRVSSMLPFMEAVEHYKAGKYNECTDILYPSRHKVRSLGGSRAQGDVFVQLLCSAIVASDNCSHDNRVNKLRTVLLERDIACGASTDEARQLGYAERMTHHILAQH